MSSSSRRFIKANTKEMSLKKASSASLSTPIQTNRPFHHKDDEETTTHYLPCYVRFLLKEIESICAVDMEAELLGNLIFSFTFEETDQILIESFTNKKEDATAIMLEFNKEAPIFLKEGKGITMKKKKDSVQFVIRQKFKVNLRGHVFLTPFEELSMYLAVTIQPVQVIEVKQDKKTLHKFKFNCMDYTGEGKDVHIIRHLSSITFGQYRVVSSHMEAAFTNSRDDPFKQAHFCRTCENHDDYRDEEKNPEETSKSRSQKKEQDIEPFHYAHFRIPVYKYPGTSILTIFVPIQILGAIGLLVFFQEPSLSSRLATIATLILAFVAFIPTVNASIPQSPTIKLVQILIFLHLVAIFLLGTQSFLSKDQNGSSFIWYDNVYFLVAALLNIVTFLTVTFLFAIHKCFWEPRLKRTVPGMLKKNPNIRPEDWTNQKCDENFRKYSMENPDYFSQNIKVKSGKK